MSNLMLTFLIRLADVKLLFSVKVIYGKIMAESVY